MGTQATMEGSLKLDQRCASRVGLKWLCRTICTHAAHTLSTARTFSILAPFEHSTVTHTEGTCSEDCGNDYLATVSWENKGKKEGRGVLSQNGKNALSMPDDNKCCGVVSWWRTKMWLWRSQSLSITCSHFGALSYLR